MKTKAEFYKSLINIHTKGGQGLSGLVRIKSTKYGEYLDEFIEEGLVNRCSSGGSLGHPESNYFYIPTNGYNVWKDNGKYLNFVRLYLNALEPETINKNEIQKMIYPSSVYLIRNPKIMKEYSEWLIINEEELKIMVNLSDIYDDNIEFDEEEINFIKSRGWYEKNSTIFECRELSVVVLDDNQKMLSISEELIELYITNSNKYDSKLKETQKDIDKCENKIKFRKKLHNWFDLQKDEETIQELI